MDLHDLFLRDGITSCGYIVDALIEPHIEAFEKLVGVELLPQIYLVRR